MPSVPDEIICTIIEAGPDKVAWRLKVLPLLMDSLHSDAVVVWNWTDKGAIALHLCLGFLPDYLRDYEARMCFIDPTPARLRAYPFEQVIDDGFLSETERKEHPYLVEHTKRTELIYRMATQGSLTSLYGGGITVHRRSGEYVPAEKALLGMCVPYLHRGLRQLISFESLNAQRACAHDLLARQPDGIIWVNRQGHVCYQNQQAKNILEKKDGLYFVADTLRLENKDDHRIFSAALRRALNDDADAGEILTVRRPSMLRPYIVRLFPLPRLSDFASPSNPAAQISISEPVAPPIEESELMKLYKLTPHQAALARLIVRGNNLKTAAKELGITVKTAGVSLRRDIFRKVDVHSQQELISLVLNSIGSNRSIN